MTPEARQLLRSILTHDEGYKQFLYTDTTGHLTIGVGRNLSNRGISLNEALYLLDDDIQYFTTKLSTTLNFFDELDDNRKIVLVCMCFNMGLNEFIQFNQFLAFIKDKEYEKAANDMLQTKWAQQVGDRAVRLSHIMKTGEL